MAKKYVLIHPRTGLPYKPQQTDTADAEKYLAWWNAMKSWVGNLAPDVVLSRSDVADQMATIMMEVR
jgi:hypothetical protein